jgi:hypothetical protein
LAKETEERINRMESEKQRALNEMDAKYNTSIEQYKEQVRKTQQLLQRECNSDTIMDMMVVMVIE